MHHAYYSGQCRNTSLKQILIFFLQFGHLPYFPPFHPVLHNYTTANKRVERSLTYAVSKRAASAASLASSTPSEERAVCLFSTINLHTLMNGQCLL